MAKSCILSIPSDCLTSYNFFSMNRMARWMLGCNNCLTAFRESPLHVCLFPSFPSSLRLFRPRFPLGRNVFAPPLLVMWRHLLPAMLRRPHRPPGPRLQETRARLQTLPKRLCRRQLGRDAGRGPIYISMCNGHRTTVHRYLIATVAKCDSGSNWLTTTP